MCQYYNPCISSPCQNSGVCVAIQTNPSSYRCNCLSGYTGTNCGTQINYLCSSQPCKNGGTCANGINTFSCSCTSSFTGLYCESLINPCQQSNVATICQNNGVCQLNTLQAPYYICLCPTGYFGNVCQYAALTTQAVSNNYCNINPCVNSVSCVSTYTYPYYTCNCQTGYTGTNCDTSKY